MLQEEFEELVGRPVTMDEYVEADAMYMAAGEMDKDEFCREYVKVGQNRLVKELADTYYDEKRCLDRKCEELEAMRGKLSAVVDALTEIAVKAGGRWTDGVAEMIWAEVRRLEGVAEVIRRKAEAGVSFTQEELKYISAHISD